MRVELQNKKTWLGLHLLSSELLSEAAEIQIQIEVVLFAHPEEVKALHDQGPHPVTCLVESAHLANTQWTVSMHMQIRRGL